MKVPKGELVGLAVGTIVNAVGARLGDAEGINVGLEEEGLEEGLEEEGLEEGLEEGTAEGLEDGLEEGSEDGLAEGSEDGLEDGLAEGAEVETLVNPREIAPW